MLLLTFQASISRRAACWIQSIDDATKATKERSLAPGGKRNDDSRRVAR